METGKTTFRSPDPIVDPASDACGSLGTRCIVFSVGSRDTFTISRHSWRARLRNVTHANVLVESRSSLPDDANNTAHVIEGALARYWRIAQSSCIDQRSTLISLPHRPSLPSFVNCLPHSPLLSDTPALVLLHSLQLIAQDVTYAQMLTMQSNAGQEIPRESRCLTNSVQRSCRRREAHRSHSTGHASLNHQHTPLRDPMRRTAWTQSPVQPTPSRIFHHALQPFPHGDIIYPGGVHPAPPIRNLTASSSDPFRLTSAWQQELCIMTDSTPA